MSTSRWAGPTAAALLSGSCTLGRVPLASSFPHPATPATASASAAPAVADPRSAPQDHSYVVPAVEIVSFEVLLNLIDRNLLDDREFYESDWDSVVDNLQSGWVVDRDPFGVNQVGHPYSGSVYHGFARSSGLGFWTALAYTFAGSALWEVAGEVTKPSLNDQITTGIGGAFLGEGFFRLATWVVADGDGTPSFGRSLAATVISPPTALNKVLFGDRFDAPPPIPEAPVFTNVGFGARTHDVLRGPGSQTAEEDSDVTANVEFEYGMPGRDRYHHALPFDLFHFEAVVSTASDNLFDRLNSRGLLTGNDYSSGDLEGVYGIYGSYDYLSPGVFRLASTALSFGTTAQQRLSADSALQGTLLAGVGFGAAGTVADDAEDRDYHYGAIPQVVLDVRLLLEGIGMLRLGARDHFVFGAGFEDNDGWENVAQVGLTLSVHVVGSHALSLGYVDSRRVAHYDTAADEDQQVGTFYVLWTLLGGTGLDPVR